MLLVLLVFLNSCHTTTPPPWHPSQYKVVDGYVPDQATAIGITESIGSAFYGKDLVNWEKPFKAQLYGDVWRVEGTLPDHDRVGGVLTMQISKKDGHIISMIHTQ